MSSIRRWPTQERPREKLLQWGAATLSDAELLALLVHTGSAKGSALEVAKQALTVAEAKGGWQHVSAGDLSDIAGLGPAKAAVVLAGVELGKRQALKAGQDERSRFNSSRHAFEFCREHLSGLDREAFLVIALDAKNRMLGSRLISVGTLTQSLVHPREVFQPALALRAAGLILAHNHPSGDPTPSQEDNEVTKRLRACADILAIPLVDHLVVGKDRYFSYADAAWGGQAGPQGAKTIEKR